MYDVLRDGITGKILIKSIDDESLKLIQLQSQQKKIGIVQEWMYCIRKLLKNYWD